MRAEYDVSDNALLGKRHVRNAFEHFDERLDTWVASSQRHNLADRIIAPREGAIVGLDPSDYMRWFDPQTKTVYVFGDSIELQALVTETEALVGRVQAKQTERELLRWTQATW